MRRILGYTANDNSLTRHALGKLRDALTPSEGERVASWGVGYEQESQVLVRKRPQAVHDVDLVQLLTDIRTQAFVAFTTDKPDPRLRTENTEPYRFRSWLSVSVGDFPGVGADGALEIPSLLERGVRGTTAGERVFFRFLACLREEGVALTNPVPPLESVCKAMARALREAEQLAAEAGVEGSPDSGLFVTNGRALVAGSVGVPMAAYHFQGLEILADSGPQRRGHRPRKIHRDHFRACMIATHVDESHAGWAPIAPREIYAIDESWTAHRGRLDDLVG